MTGKSAAVILRQMHSQVVVLFSIIFRVKLQNTTNTLIFLLGYQHCPKNKSL